MDNCEQNDLNVRGLGARKGQSLIWAALLLTSLASSCWGQIVDDDPLHGYCAGAGQCIDNGTNAPTSTNAPTNFGFTISPANSGTGDLVLDLLIPDNEADLTSYGVTGTLSGTLTQLPGTWTSGQLDSFLGISASPTNAIGAYLPSTQALQTTDGIAKATGFFVFQADLGQATINGPSSPNVSPLLNLSSYLPLASYLVAFLNEGTAAQPNWIATANSSAIFVTSPGGGGGTGGGGPRSAVPEPASILLLGTVALLITQRFARRSRAS